MIKTISLQLDAKHMSRFYLKPKVTNGDCVEWGACIDRQGYGKFSVNGAPRRAHRVAWVIANGDIPEGLYVCHVCDNPKCVNAAHLFLGTLSDNAKDRAKKGRFVEKNGRAKLAKKDVKAIRSDARSARVIAQAYGVASVTIYRVKNFRTWKHVSAEELG